MSDTAASPTSGASAAALAAGSGAGDLTHRCCRVAGLANVSAKTVQNGQFVVTERRVTKGALKGRYKVRVVGTQQIFAVRPENLLPCATPPPVLLHVPATASRLQAASGSSSSSSLVPLSSSSSKAAAPAAPATGGGTAASAAPPFLPDVDAVEQSCTALLACPAGREFVRLNEARVAEFAEGVAGLVRAGGDACAKLRQGASGACRRLPLQFDSPAVQVNFWVTKSLLNFGSGYVGGSARELADLVDRGCLSAFLTRAARFDAEFLSRFGLHDVQALFGIQVEEDVSVIGTAVTRSQLGGPKLPLAQLIVRTLNATGERLRRLGCADFSTLLSTAQQVALAAADDAADGDAHASPVPPAEAATPVGAPAIASIARELMGVRPALRSDPAGLIVAILAYCFDGFRDVSVYQTAATAATGAGEENFEAQADAEAGAREWTLRPVVFLQNAQAAVLDVARVLGSGGDAGWERVAHNCVGLRLGGSAGVAGLFLRLGLVEPAPALLEAQGALAAAAAAKAAAAGEGPATVAAGRAGDGGGTAAAAAAATARPLFKPDTHATNAVRAACVVACARIAAAAGVSQPELQYHLERITTGAGGGDGGGGAGDGDDDGDGDGDGGRNSDAAAAPGFVVLGTPFF